MKRLSLGIGTLVIALLLSSVSFAADSVGAGQLGSTIIFGYDGADLTYKEFVDGSVINKDTGWLNGVFAEYRYDLRHAFFRANIDAIGSDDATYDGALQDGTPLRMSTEELIFKTELDAGYKLFNFGRATLTPYIGIGYRWWERGEDDLPDFEEEYSWWYGVAGVNLAVRAADRLLIGVDAALLWPIDPEMETDIAGLVDEAEFDIESEVGYRVEVPVIYEISKTSRSTFLAFITPYYERWNIGASDTVILTWRGMPVAPAFEPKSHTELFGFKAGVGFHF